MSSPTSDSVTPISVEAIAFDLLSALLDSPTLWEHTVMPAELGRTWHFITLQTIASTGAYTPYVDVLHQTATELDVPPQSVNRLLQSWPSLRPWSDTNGVLAKLAGRRLAIVTNCTQKLAEIAAGIPRGAFELVMSAEKSGAYKPDSRAYEAALKSLGLQPQQVLFVAGSMYDVLGAGNVGIPVYWANRYNAAVPAGARAPLVNAPDLRQLPALLGIS